LLALTGICGLLLAPVAVEVGRYRRETAVWARLSKSFRHGASTGEAHFVPSVPWWLGRRGVEIRIDGLHVSVAGLDILAELSDLDSLEIRRTMLGKPEIQAIARLSTLESLDLSGCQLPDDALRSLAQLRRLKILQVQNTGVPESAVIELQEALPGLEVLDD
jgi:hypothetical protein